MGQRESPSWAREIASQQKVTTPKVGTLLACFLRESRERHKTQRVGAPKARQSDELRHLKMKVPSFRGAVSIREPLSIKKDILDSFWSRMRDRWTSGHLLSTSQIRVREAYLFVMGTAISAIISELTRNGSKAKPSQFYTDMCCSVKLQQSVETSTCAI